MGTYGTCAFPDERDDLDLKTRLTPPRRAWAVLLALAGCAAGLAANWPGHFPPDAIWQLAQGRAGIYNSWHPPVMAWMLGLADRLSPDAAAFIVFESALFWGALAAFACLRRTAWPALGLLVVIAASPLAFLYQGLVLKDVLFADAAVAGFAALAWAARTWERPGARFALVGAALALFTLAALTRQNGVLVALAGAAALAAIAAAKGARAPALHGVVAVLLMTAAGAGATAALATHGDRQPELDRQFTALQIFDLTGAVHHDPAEPLAAMHAMNPALERFIRVQAASGYTASRVDTIAAKAPVADAFLARAEPAARAQWRSLVVGSPWLYLRTRAEVFRQAFLTPDIDACAAVMVGVDPGNPVMLGLAGLSPRETDRDDWDGDYASAFLHTPAFSHLTYFVLAVALLAWAIVDARRGKVEVIAVAGLLVAALAVAASYFVIALACDYRYLYFLDCAAMAAVVHRAASLASARNMSA
jgi:hypothetical protein